jgi:transposase InsO family protein
MKKRLKALESKVAKENGIYTEEQLALLERQKDKELFDREIETIHPGYLGSQDTFYVGILKGVGRIYQQTFVDTYSRVALCKLYNGKGALAAADLLSDKVLPFFQKYRVDIVRILTDRGTEFCGKMEEHEYELYLSINNIYHAKTKV